MRLYNTLGRSLGTFEPIEPGRVGLYVCGMTVYDDCHVGHARAMVVYDVLYRHLLARGLDVTYVRNITDVEDKIIARAAREGTTPEAIVERHTASMQADARALGNLEPTLEPRATAAIGQMVELIGRLIDSGHAYAPGNGDVYYAVEAFEGYGKLSGRRPEELRAGARVAVDEAKRDPIDFALWKAAKPGEPAWDSPWGRGRPGWHIECSAMAREALGDTFDIHGGGLDLEFPHHENEIAQSEAATGAPLARWWLHNGLVTVEGEKMSKSLGNFRTIRDALGTHTGEELRYFIVASHYRSPVNYADAQLDAARAALRGLYPALRGVDRAGAGGGGADGSPGEVPPAGADPEDPAARRFEAAMDDDLNTPEAIAALHELAGRLNVAKSGAGDPDRAACLARTLVALGARLGLLEDDPEAVLQRGAAGAGAAAGGLDAPAIEALVAERTAARSARDFARADAIRDELAAAGVELEDAGGTTRWRRS